MGPEVRRRILVAAAVAGMVLMLGGAVWAWVHVPALYPAPAAGGDAAVAATREATRSQAIVTTRASVLAALAGLGALVTITINYRNSQTTNRTFRITERGHLTDRYAKAIEQLGNEDSLAIRLGGIYALQQFATETDRAADQTTVVEVLSAFVRTNLPRRGGSGPPDADPASTAPGPEAPRAAEDPPPDVLAAVSVLAQLPDRGGLRADFAGVDFAGVRLSQARLNGGDLTGSYLAGADLTSANLAGANLTSANLTSANLTSANLANANLVRAKLVEANFTRADLTRADLTRADLTRADFTDATLFIAVLVKADLTAAFLAGDADFAGPFLANANLAGANLTRANLAVARLGDAGLAGAILVKADLTDADLTGADLTRADLTGADLTRADLTRADLVDANLTRVRGLTSEQLSNKQRAGAWNVVGQGRWERLGESGD